MTDGDNETEMEERWRKPAEAASRKRGVSRRRVRKLNLSSKWLRLRQQNEILHSHAHTEKQPSSVASTWTKSPAHEATFYRPDAHFVCTLSRRGLCSCGPRWMSLIATHTGCMQSSKCLLRRDSLARSNWTAHAAHASTTVYPCMHRAPAKHALSFAHGDRSFKGVFHTSSHFN